MKPFTVIASYNQETATTYQVAPGQSETVRAPTLIYGPEVHFLGNLDTFRDELLVQLCRENTELEAAHVEVYFQPFKTISQMGDRYY